MSFWPFGQNINNSNINKLLDDYFHVLRDLEAQSKDSTGGVDDNKQSQTSASGAMDPIPEDTIISPVPLNATIAQDPSPQALRPASSPSLKTQRNVDPSESESLSSSTSTSSVASLTGTVESPMTLQSLNNSFIDNLLQETELLNELTRQNNTLLDFICFGYFYDAYGTKVENIEYLIDQLMICIDKINEHDDNEPDDKDLQVEQEGGPSTQTQPNDDSNDISTPSVDNQEEDDQSSYLNKATIISEIFSLDIWLISESLVKNSTYLATIWSILHHPNFSSEKSPLIPIFLKINQNLLLTRQDQYLNFIRTRENLVGDFLKHIGISVLMDFFLKVISTDKQESPTGIIELVYEQGLISKLLNYLDNGYHADIQACAGDFIKALIAISANAPLDDMSIGPNSLTRQLCSEQCIDLLLNAIVNKRGAALTTAVSIVIELIRKNNSDYDQVNLLTTTVKTHPPSIRDPIYLGVMLKKFAVNLPEFYRILLDVENDDRIPLVKNQLNQEYKPLGFERFKVVELIAELLHCSNMGLMNSKKAERIVKERDEVRQGLTKQLEDALAELDMGEENDNINDANNNNSTTTTNNTITDNNDTVTTSNENNDEVYEKVNEQNNKESPDDANDEEEIDESFEIPYVNPSQNAKLRLNPTTGDLFKINLYDTQILPKIIELFLRYPWNNFWHNVLFDIIQQIFSGRMDFSYNSFLVYSLFNNKGSAQFMLTAKPTHVRDFRITADLILQGYRDSHDFYEVHETNLGYMGHLVLIAEEIVKFSKVYKVELISPDIYEVLQDEAWIFYSEDVLNDTRVMYSKILGGGDYMDDGGENAIHDLASPSSSESGGDLINVSNYGQELQQHTQANAFSTQSDLHKKLKEKLIKESQSEVDRRNKEKGVIVLGMTPEEIANQGTVDRSNNNGDNE